MDQPLYCIDVHLQLNERERETRRPSLISIVYMHVHVLSRYDVEVSLNAFDITRVFMRFGHNVGVTLGPLATCTHNLNYNSNFLNLLFTYM